MYICPTCGQEYETEDDVRKHYLSCWKKKNPNCKSKSAPRGEDVEMRQVNEDVMNFFNLWQKKN